MTKELAPSEKSQLKACEGVIERARTAFTEAGMALRDIRDKKLYRGSHGTFDAYCHERWGYSRTRAYELIDQAGVVAAIEAATGSKMSDASDISARAVKAIKGNPEAIAEIKERVAAGEEPTTAIKAVANEASSAPAKPQPTAVEPSPRLAPHQADDDHADEIEELRAINEDLTAENAKLRAQVEALEPMLMEFERGGFAEVIKGLRKQIDGLKTRVSSESAEKVKNLNSAEYWKKKAIESGWSRDAVIDLETGEITNG